MFPPVPLPSRPGKTRFPFVWCFACGISLTLLCLLHAEPARKANIPAAPPRSAIPLVPHVFVVATPAVGSMCEVERCGWEMRGPTVPPRALSPRPARDNAASEYPCSDPPIRPAAAAVPRADDPLKPPAVLLPADPGPGRRAAVPVNGHAASLT